MSAINDSGKRYHNQCTGLALDTVNQHTTPEDITLFGSCFCPFVQRVWIAFEYLGIPYKVSRRITLIWIFIRETEQRYSNSHVKISTVRIDLYRCSVELKVTYADEVDPYKKPKELLEVSPKGLVPGLKLHNFNPPRALNESTVILEYVEEYV